MWESRRDFQRVWEGWKAGFMVFHAFHTLSFPWPVFRVARAADDPYPAHVDVRIGDSLVQMRDESFRTGAPTSHHSRLIGHLVSDRT